MVCGYRVINQHTGILESPIMIRESPLNFYYHQDCTWLLDSNVERHLTIEIGSSQSRECKIILRKKLTKVDALVEKYLITGFLQRHNKTNQL